jgi:hypothetical protein
VSALASAFVDVRPDMTGFGSKLESGASSAGDSAGKSFSSKFGAALKIGAAVAGAFALAKGADFLKGSIDEAREAQKVGAQTTAVLKSTGGAANITAKQIGDLSSAISKKVGIDDEAIQSSANLLLTFTNVRNEVGKGNDIFNQATQTITDMSVALGSDAKGSAIQLGKALNDPVKGITALTRVGVSFTDEQKKQIAQMVKNNDTLGAQKIILGELNKEFGGSAAAAATAGDKFKVAFGNLQEQVGTALLPILDKVQGVFTDKVIPAVSRFISQMQSGKGAGGEFVDVLKNMLDAGKSVYGAVSDLVHFFSGLPGPVKSSAIQIGIFVFAINKITPAATQGVASLTALQARMAGMSKSALGLRAGAGAAGALGLSLTALGGHSTKTEKAVSALGYTASGALLGFAAGGPIGAAVGGGVGLIAGLATALFHSGGAAKTAAPKIADYASTLDEATGAVTRLTRAEILKQLAQEGAVAAAHSLGVATQDLIGQVLGQASAIRRVNQDVAKSRKTAFASGEIPEFFARLDNLHGALGIVTSDFRTQQQQVKQNAQSTSTYKDALKSLPHRAYVALKNLDYEVTYKQLVGLQKQYDLTPKQVKTVMDVLNVPPTQAKIKGTTSLLTALDRQRANPSVSVDTSSAVNSLDHLFSLIRSIPTHVGPVSGARAAGGPVARGRTYLVGERGPELFTAQSPGRIVPNHELGGAASSRATVHVENMYAVDTRGAARDLRREQEKANMLAGL